MSLVEFLVALSGASGTSGIVSAQEFKVKVSSGSGVRDDLTLHDSLNHWKDCCRIFLSVQVIQSGSYVL